MFGCTASVAMREIDIAPMGLLETIRMFRNYAHLKAELKAAEAREDKTVFEDARFNIVREIEYDLVETTLRKRRG